MFLVKIVKYTLVSLVPLRKLTKIYIPQHPPISPNLILIQIMLNLPSNLIISSSMNSI